MSHSNSSSNPPRPTLTLKPGVRKSLRENRTQSNPGLKSKVTTNPDARWSDEYMERMQADMDALTTTRRPYSR